MNEPNMTPRIVRPDGEDFGQPTLEEGYTVLQVVKMVKYSDYSISEAAERLRIPERSVVAAIEYYEENTEEIESLKEEEDSVVREFKHEGSM